ncbi:MAG: hypothetical protein KAT68_14075 [Bacteroidales bacterium]|nr:hypothetical protein [Bacteroidales bacterium]
MKISCFIIVVIISFHNIYAQEMLGISTGNYAGTMSLYQNPALIADTKLYLDINVLSSHLFFHNNYIYYDKKNNNLKTLIDSSNSVSSIRNILGEYNDGKLKNGYFNLRIPGPSAMLSIGRQSFAFSTSFRAVGSVRQVPFLVSHLGFFGITDNEKGMYDNFTGKEFKLNGIAWNEIGLSYAYVLGSKQYKQLSAGITLKGLLGTAGGYYNNEIINLTEKDDSTLVDINFTGEYAISMPVNYGENKSSLLFNPTGFGLSLDIGILLQENIKTHSFSFHSISEQKYYGYKYRLGISIIDFGFIRFKKNSDKLFFNNVTTNWTSINNIDFDNVKQYNRSLSYIFYNDSTLAIQDNKFTIWLPTVISTQFDYHYYKQFYFSAVIFQGIPMFKNQVRRPSLFSFIPRFESKNYGIFLPISLYDFKYPHLGLAISVEYVTIGTDKIRISNKKINSSDFYFSIKIPFVKNQAANF